MWLCSLSFQIRPSAVCCFRSGSIQRSDLVTVDRNNEENDRHHNRMLYRWVKTVTSWKHVDFPRGNITFKATQTETKREGNKIWFDYSELLSAAEPPSLLHLVVCTFDRPPEIWNMASHHLIERNIIVVRKRNVTYNLFGATAATVLERHPHAYLHILVSKKQERTVRYCCISSCFFKK